MGGDFGSKHFFVGPQSNDAVIPAAEAAVAVVMKAQANTIFFIFSRI